MTATEYSRCRMPLLPDLLVLVRHGESHRNLAKAGKVFFADEQARRHLVDIPDHGVGLTDTGWAQARAVGTRLYQAFGTFDLVFHSGYRRATETADGILEAWPAPARARMTPREHLLLRERDTGYAANMTDSEAQSAFPWLQDYWFRAGPFIARPPGGESLADVATRVRIFMDSLEHELADQRVLIATHAGTLRMFRYLFEGWTHDQIVERWHNEPVPNGQVVAYQRDAAQGRLQLTTVPA